MGIALVGYTVYPTAPPRFFFPEYGFEDTVAQLTGVGHDAGVNALFNPYAAVPSMHVCFAIFVGFTLARAVKHRWARIAWALWPLVMTWVVVTTANHWIADAFLGARHRGASPTARGLAGAGAARPPGPSPASRRARRA